MARQLTNNRRATTITQSAPTGGWNARDPLAMMKVEDAVILDNMVPKTTEVVTRQGCIDWATGMTGNVDTIMSYSKGDGTYNIFACTSSSIFNATSSGAVGAAVVTGLSNGRWECVNMATSGGKFLLAVNGTDDPRLYNGTTWSIPAITGVTLNTLAHINLYQRRVWLVEKNSMKVHYLPVDSIAGAVSTIDLSALFPMGGFLMAMGTWTIDSGSGMDDHAVFISSNGEVAVYRGTDPSSAATWSLVGVYSIGSPINRRCFTKYGSDLLIICQDGVQPLSAALQSSRVSTKVSITDKIQRAMSESVSTYRNNFGWQLKVFPPENLLILNVPVTGGSQQYVMYTITGAWCRFLNWNAQCFEMVGDVLYFGTNGKICKAYTGQSDSGAAINAEALPSFQYHGGMALKRYTLARPIISIDNPSYGILLGLNLDFDQTPPIGTPTFSTSTVATWDTGLWDVNTWGGDGEIKKSWQTIGGVGYCAAIHMKTSSAFATIKWQSVDYVAETGNGL